MKARQTLANEHLPIWTAHLNNWGTYHKLHPELSRAVGGFVAYHDLEKNSAVLYDTHRKTLSGSIGTKYHITGLPITLLHQCHKVKGPYLKIGRHVSHRTTDHPEPPNDVIGRFENCGERSSLSDISPFSSQKPHSSENSIFKTKEKKCDKDKFNKRDIDSIHQNATKIRKRREQPEHFYIEILLFVPHSIVIYYKNLLLERYLLGIIRFHLLYFNSIDMLYANLQTNDLHIHINLAGIIIEDDKGAFDSVIDYSKHAIKPHLGELYYSRFLRYLEYYDLPYEKDSIDLIFITNSHQVLSEHHAKPLGGLTRNDINRYRTRQIYKRIDNVPLTIAIFTGNLYEYCVGAHEIGHALMIPHDPSDIELMKNGQCYGIMQISGPNCFSCINWSHESINSLQDFTRYKIANKL
ncbi:hypothetical protein PV325_010747 [Microctonus aethiopoides]|nr:hypothetical protein PV325_010747 [Microctonus aethiopoides]